MNYELARELKDAGWPQWLRESVRTCFYYNEFGTLMFWPWGDQEPDLSEYTRSPDLSELIEACGIRFQYLSLHPAPDSLSMVWEARANWNMQLKPLDSKGKTPEEAVARLWLALNKTI